MKKKEYGYLSYIVMHPVEGFEEFIYYKAGSIPLSIGILTVWFLSKIIERQGTAFIHNLNNPEKLNAFYILVQTVILFALWCISNWAFCTLMDGKGTFRNIWVCCSYALVPMVLSTFIATAVSGFLSLDEGIFRALILIVGYAWTIWLLFNALRTVHDYSFGKTVVSVSLTLFGIGCICFLLVLTFSLYKQAIDLFHAIYNEIMFRF